MVFSRCLRQEVETKIGGEGWVVPSLTHFAQHLRSLWTRMHKNNWNFPATAILLTSHAHNQAGCCNFTSSEFKNRPEVSTVILSDMPTMAHDYVCVSLLINFYIYSFIYLFCLKNHVPRTSGKQDPRRGQKRLVSDFDLHAAGLVVSSKGSSQSRGRVLRRDWRVLNPRKFLYSCGICESLMRLFEMELTWAVEWTKLVNYVWWAIRQNTQRLSVKIRLNIKYVDTFAKI